MAHCLILTEAGIQQGPSYPKLIRDGWPDIPFDAIDAAVTWGKGKAYFFREDQYVRYDMNHFQVDPSYPKRIRGSYIEDWKFLD